MIMKTWLLRLIALILIPSIYFLLFGYPLLRLHQLINPGQTLPLTLFYSLLFFPLISRILYETISHISMRWLSAISRNYLGFAFMLLLFLLVFECINYWVPLESHRAAGTIIILALGMSIYAYFNAQHHSIKEIILTSPKLKRAVKLVHLSDVHIGTRSRRFLAKVVQQVQKIQPDYVAITGDLIDLRALPIEKLSPFKQLTMPIYYSIGNHERYVDLNILLKKLSTLDFIILRDTAVEVEDIQFIGIDDASPKHTVERALQNISVNPSAYSILLYHRPVGFEDATNAGIDLMLSGHTHKGQITPFNYLTKLYFRRIAGLYQLGSSYLYVSPGTGTWGPSMRLGSRNEITVIHLKPV